MWGHVFCLSIFGPAVDWWIVQRLPCPHPRSAGIGFSPPCSPAIDNVWMDGFRCLLSFLVIVGYRCGSKNVTVSLTSCLSATKREMVWVVWSCSSSSQWLTCHVDSQWDFRDDSPPLTSQRGCEYWENRFLLHHLFHYVNTDAIEQQSCVKVCVCVLCVKGLSSSTSKTHPRIPLRRWKKFNVWPSHKPLSSVINTSLTEISEFKCVWPCPMLNAQFGQLHYTVHSSYRKSISYLRSISYSIPHVSCVWTSWLSLISMNCQLLSHDAGNVLNMIEVTFRPCQLPHIHQ